MRVLHLSAAAETTGAGKATLLTHEALLNHNIDSRVFLLKSELDAKNVSSYHKQGVFYSIRRLISTFVDRSYVKKYKNRKDQIFSSGFHGLPLKNNRHLKWADVIHIHWANHGFIDIKEIAKWNKPVVWTLRDMWAFTGGCHQSFDCLGFEKNCGNCPVLSSANANDLSFKALTHKRNILTGLPIRWIAISSWLKDRAGKSKILNVKKIDVVFSGVDSTMFRIGNKAILRGKYNFSITDKIIVLGAGDFREEYKGFSYVIDVLNRMDSNIKILTFGSKGFDEGEIQQKSIHFGFISSDILEELYSLADVFFSPSIAEAFGKTFLEAQMCGCPVVCFDETGPADIIIHKETGYLAKFKDIDDLLVGLEYCLRTNFEASTIRNKAVSIFDISNIALDYIKIYEESYLDWSNSRSK
jgi:glycosyltransferase involved in cell wall biosynthesis